MQALKAMEQTVHDAPDQQVSLTDPDARSMATSGKGTATVGYNVQIAVDAEHHLIVAHEVTNQGYDRHQLAPMAFKAQQATGCEQITALADRGYFNGDQVLSCEGTGVSPIVPKTFANDDGAISFAACPIPTRRWRGTDSNLRFRARIATIWSLHFVYLIEIGWVLAK